MSVHKHPRPRMRFLVDGAVFIYQCTVVQHNLEVELFSPRKYGRKHCSFHTDQLCWFMPINSAGFMSYQSALLVYTNQLCWFHANQLNWFIPTNSPGLNQPTLLDYTNQLYWFIPTNSPGLYQPSNHAGLYQPTLCFPTNRLCGIDEQTGLQGARSLPSWRQQMHHRTKHTVLIDKSINSLG